MTWTVAIGLSFVLSLGLILLDISSQRRRIRRMKEDLKTTHSLRILK